MHTRFDAEGLVIGDAGERRVPFYAGAMHYWRVPPAQWAACLKTMHAIGFTLVETYVPWRVHAPERDEDVWSEERDLPRFLETARAAGLHVIVRPGPHINAELTSFGIPDWVLAEPEVQARTSRGTPAWLPVPPRAFPIPSYASRAFHELVRGWYEQVARVIAPYLGDPVVAIGVDNEAQMFFRTGAYDLDYHPDALVWWDELHPGVAAPRAWTAESAAVCAQWVDFKDTYLARSLGAFSTMLRDVGFRDLAMFHNLPPGDYRLYNLDRIQRAIQGPVGIDAYTPRSLFRELRRRASACVGDAHPIPIAFEVGVGFFPWFPPLDASEDPTRERDHLLTLLSQGIRGFNLFMAVERDRYYGAAISEGGVAEKHAAWIAPLLATLKEIEWPRLRRETKITVVSNRADERYGIASCVIDPMTPALADVLGLGPGGATELGRDPAAIESRKWQNAVCGALELAQVPYNIAHESVAAARPLSTVIVPTIDRIDSQLWAKLHALRPHGEHATVVLGPNQPKRDELEQPLRKPPELATKNAELTRPRIGMLNAESLDDLPGLAEDLAGLAGEQIDSWQIERPDEVRTTWFADAAGTVRAVFVISDADRAVTATLLADAPSLRDAITGEVIRVSEGKARISMHPLGVRMLIV